MGWRTYKEEYYPEWRNYTGAYEIATFDMTGPPEQVVPAQLVGRLFELFITTFETHGETLMYIKVEYDIAPTWETKYSVTTYSHDYVQLIVAGLVIALGLLLIYLISWNVKEMVKSLPDLPSLGWIAIVAVAFIVLMGIKEVRRPKGKRG